MKKLVLKSFMQIERWSDSIKNLWRQSPAKAPVLVLFEHYATPHQIIVKGRALCEELFPVAQPSDTMWLNFHRTLRWANSHELIKEPITIQFQGKTYTTTTDEEGYFYKKIILEHPIAYHPIPHYFKIQLTNYAASQTNGAVYLPPPEAQLGIISDIDDTVMISNVRNPLKLVWLTFFRNSTTRRVFEEVSEWYQMLRLGKKLETNHPFFYVSSSPWNLYNLIKNVLKHNHIPNGTLLLQDYGIDDNKFIIGTHKNHKAAAIQEIMDTYPTMKFILIGDSSQRDLWIYGNFKQQFPNRIRAIYIRNVGYNAAFKKQLHHLNQQGIMVHLINHSKEGLEHSLAKILD